MKKMVYMISEDEFSGQVAIEVTPFEREVDIYVPTMEEQLAAIYLYRELPKKMVTKTFYSIKAFYHYEQGKQNELFSEIATSQEEADKIVKGLKVYLK